MSQDKGSPQDAESPPAASGQASALQQSTCPFCGKTLHFRQYRDLPAFPFCSRRCKFLDLSRWLREEYSLNREYDPMLDDEEAEPE